jgi:exodeoxyribonuclease V alpha subunit
MRRVIVLFWYPLLAYALAAPLLLIILNLRDCMEAYEAADLAGTVDEVIYANEENGYTVLRLETDGGEQATVVGCLPFAAPGEQLILSGRWVSHPTHGRQFQAEYVERSLPRGVEAVYEYLASRVIKGVGPATASVIVSAFGEKSLEVIEREPEKLAQVRGISLKKAREMSEALRRQLGLRRLMEFLSSNGLKLHYAMRLYQRYGEEALERVSENPYLLSRPEIGAEFAEADALARALGMDDDSPERLDAALCFELQHNSGNGHVFIPREKLLLATQQLIDSALPALEERLDLLLADGQIICESIAGCEACYLHAFHAAETRTAERLLRLAGEEPVCGAADLDAVIAEIERQQSIRYAPLQRRTLELAARQRVMVITGGPGTGKTTTVRALIALFERFGLSVQLAAPTGRAAKRMGELSGREAQTIHRLLEAGYAPDGFDLLFHRDAENPLRCDVLIVDECSMVDITLMAALLTALPDVCRLILVGDADQLPSVGPGNVFLDILRSNRIPAVRLTEIFRQTAESRIVRYAHQINAGEHPAIGENKGDFFFLRRLSADAATELVVQLCATRLPEKLGIPPAEIQVLTPMRKGAAGVYALNAALQAALNPPAPGKKEHPYGERIFRTGDRVMQIRNNYDIIWTTADKTESGTGVFNGDIGYVRALDPVQETLTVDFDGHTVTYDFDQLPELEHAWAMTVHKAQGSEYRAVILCLTGAPQRLAYRGVLFTAVTRARELLIAVGDDALIDRMIDNQKQARRYSGLRARLAQEKET